MNLATGLWDHRRRQPPPHGVDQPERRCRLQFVNADAPLDDGPRGQQLGAQGPRQKAALDGRRHPIAPQLDDDIGFRRFRDLTFAIPEEHGVRFDS